MYLSLWVAAFGPEPLYMYLFHLLLHVKETIYICIYIHIYMQGLIGLSKCVCMSIRPALSLPKQQGFGHKTIGIQHTMITEGKHIILKTCRHRFDSSMFKFDSIITQSSSIRVQLCSICIQCAFNAQ